jgi:hypothetical protein
MVHATTETVSRLLARFERDGQARSTRDGIWWRTSRTPSLTPDPPSARALVVSDDRLPSSPPSARSLLISADSDDKP